MFSNYRIGLLFLSAALAGMFFLLSCTYKYLGPQAPETFHAPLCPDETESQAQLYAFRVILNAMNARNWHISSIDRHDFEIHAQPKGADWSRVEVKVKPGGIISVQRKIEKNLSRRNYERMKEAIDDLKKLYFKLYRCKSGGRHSR